MNLYTFERLVLDRHESVIREAEKRSRLLGGGGTGADIGGSTARKLGVVSDSLNAEAVPEPQRSAA